MITAEYVRNLNCNYERILLEKKPEENRYQYCIVGRGGIKRLLPCSLRYINGQAYLYYDISSTQSLAQLYAGRTIKREWVKDFLWSMKQVRRELDRFLLDDSNLLWYPEHIFQDLEKRDFSYLYIPYYEGDCGFREMLDFLVERIDYEDEGLVDCIYTMHEQYSLLGEAYIQGQIFEDAGKLDEPMRVPQTVNAAQTVRMTQAMKASQIPKASQKASAISGEADLKVLQQEVYPQEFQEVGMQERKAAVSESSAGEKESAKKGIFYFLGGKRRRQQEERMQLQNRNQQLMSACAVAEDSTYVARMASEEEEDEEEYGRTVYMEEKEEIKVYRLYSAEGKILCVLDKPNTLIGKKRGEADCVLEDNSISRLHARVTEEKGEYYLEDLNSTNGTYKNGLRLQPYEKRKLQAEDEIRLGKVLVVFR